MADTPPLTKVSFEADSTMAGWNAPPVAEWLEASMNKASQAFFGKPSMYMGTGGTIPFMGMLGEKFPEAQFLITGLLGPNSNAHGPNEFLHIETGKRLTSCVAQVLEDHYNAQNRHQSRRLTPIGIAIVEPLILRISGSTPKCSGGEHDHDAGGYGGADDTGDVRAHRMH